jgi:hypothetical protein
MDQESTKKNARQVLVDKLIELGSRVFKPDADPDARAQSEREFDELVQR